MGINLTPEQFVIASLVAYWVGATARVLWPYVLERSKTGVSFDWHYVIGQGLATLGGFVLILANPGTVESLGSLGILGGLAGGFALASVGRNGQKTVDVARGK